MFAPAKPPNTVANCEDSNWVLKACIAANIKTAKINANAADNPCAMFVSPITTVLLKNFHSTGAKAINFNFPNIIIYLNSVSFIQ